MEKSQAIAEGDGIGSEIMLAVRRILNEEGANLEYQEGESAERVGTKELAIAVRKFLEAKPEKLKLITYKSSEKIKTLRDYYSPHSKASQQPRSHSLA